MLDFTSKETKDIAEEDRLEIVLSRKTANILLGILAKSERQLNMNDGEWQYFNDASGEIIGAIWQAKEDRVTKKVWLGKFYTDITYTFKFHDGLQWRDYPDIFNNKLDCLEIADQFLVFELFEHKKSLVAYSKGDETKDARYH